MHTRLSAYIWKQHILQDMVLDFIHDAYHGQTGTLVVPKSLTMKKELSNSRDINELKAYRTKNRYNWGNIFLSLIVSS